MCKKTTRTLRAIRKVDLTGVLKVQAQCIPAARLLLGLCATCKDSSRQTRMQGPAPGILHISAKQPALQRLI